MTGTRVLGVVAVAGLVLGAFGVGYVVAWVRHAEPDCWTADQVHLLEGGTSPDGRWAVYERITGLHDKMIFTEVYPADVTFDGCGKASRRPLAVSEGYASAGEVLTVRVPGEVELGVDAAREGEGQVRWVSTGP